VFTQTNSVQQSRLVEGVEKNHGLTASGTVPLSSGTQIVSISALSRTTYPKEADFLLAFSTVPGYVAVRHTLRGSLFVRVSSLEQITI